MVFPRNWERAARRTPLVCWLSRLVKAGGAREVGAGVWPFPKQRYHQKIILMSSQDLPNPQHLNINHVPYKESIPTRARAVPLPLWR